MKKTILIPIIVIVFVCIGFGYSYWSKDSGIVGVSKKDSPIKQAPLSVNTLVVDTISNATVQQYPALIIARESATVTSEMSGIIRTINFRDGQKVKKGQLLATIDQREVNAEIDKRIRMSEFLRNKLERQRLLFQKNGVSSEIIEQLETELEQLEAEIELFKIRKSKMNINAPFSGTVSTKLLSVGSFVSTGTPLTTIVSTNDLLAEFKISEKHSSLLSIGTSVEIIISNQKKPIRATIESVQPSIDEVTKSITVRAKFSTNESVFVGSTSVVQIEQRTNSVVKIPSIALVGTSKETNVYVVKNGKAELVSVSTGLRTSYDIEILSGLTIGDTVITTGLPYLKPKIPVSIKLIERVL